MHPKRVRVFITPHLSSAEVDHSCAWWLTLHCVHFSNVEEEDRIFEVMSMLSCRGHVEAVMSVVRCEGHHDGPVALHFVVTGAQVWRLHHSL